MKQPIALQLEGISHDFQYIFTNKGVVKISEQLNDLNGKNFLEYTDENLNAAVDILKENLNFLYKNGHLTLEKFTTEPRRFLNMVVQELKIPNYVNILKEWENKFGSKLLLINESVDNLIIESRINDSWNSIKLIIEDFWSDTWVGKGLSTIGRGAKSVAKAVGGVASSAWNWVKDKAAKAYNCLTSDNKLYCIMEGIREFAYSAVGVGVMTAASVALPVFGQVSDGILYGTLLIWDIYKLSSGKYNTIEVFMDILMDILGIVFPLLIKGVKPLLKGIGTFFGFGKAAATKGGILKKAYNLIVSGLSKVKGFIGKAATWIGEKMGLKSLANWASNATSKVMQFTNEMVSGFKSVSPKVGKVVKPTLAGVIGFKVTSGLCKYLGLDWNCSEKDVQNAVAQGKFTQEEIAAANEKYQNELAKEFENMDLEFEI